MPNTPVSDADSGPPGPARPVSDPIRSLTRSTLALAVDAGASAGLGAVFWVLAARLYTPMQLGQDSALVSLMMLLSAASTLNLGLALPRFLPQLGRRSARAVLLGYGLSSATAVALTALTLAIIPNLSRSLHFIGSSWGLALLVGFAVVLWNIFSVQDAVLMALRRTAWLPVENGIFGIAKLALMVLWAKTNVGHGVFLAWVVPMAVLVVPVNYLLFRRAIPHHVAHSGGGTNLLAGVGARRRIVSYLALDYASSLLVQGATTMLPLLVVVLLGAETNAYFYVAFTVSSAIDQLTHTVGLSLTVEGSFDESALGRLTRHAFLRIGTVLTLGIALVTVFAPWLLWIFGHSYSTRATTVLRLLAVGTIFQTVLNFYQAVERCAR